jgi:hypothetical protein
MAHIQRRFAVALALAGAAAGMAFANLPEVQTQGSVSFMTGGIGLDESVAMRQEEAP